MYAAALSCSYCNTYVALVYNDIATLLTTSEGKEYADLSLRAENSLEKFHAHRIIVSLRSEYLRRKVQTVEAGATVEVEGVTTDNALREVLQFQSAVQCPQTFVALALYLYQHAATIG